MKIITVPVALLLVLCSSKVVNAMQAFPDFFEIVQPNGGKVTLQAKGDETFSFMIDTKGRLVDYQSCPYTKNCHEYVIYDINDDCTVVNTGILANIEIDLKTNNKKTYKECASVWARYPKSRNDGFRRAPQLEKDQDEFLTLSPARARARRATDVTEGDVKNLVILMRWANHADRELPTVKDFDNLLNDVNNNATHYPSGSLRKAYLENSYGKLHIDSVITEWLDLEVTEKEVAGGASGVGSGEGVPKALVAALKLAEKALLAQGIDFKKVFDSNSDGVIDMVTFIHSGHGAEYGRAECDADGGAAQADRIWSHKWSLDAAKQTWQSKDGVRVNKYHISPGVWDTCGSELGRVGVIAHELGHFLGLPDFYDYNNPGDGTGSYDLMANSWGFTRDQLCFPHMSPYNKMVLNWLTPEDITSDGFYSLKLVEKFDKVFKINKGFKSPLEYFLIENRQPYGTEWCIPQGGLAIFHIDETVTSNNVDDKNPELLDGIHYKVAVVQADGKLDLEAGNNRGDEGDLWSTATQTTFDPTTTPNTHAYMNGNIYSTNIAISKISAAQETMSFDIKFDAPSIPNIEKCPTKEEEKKCGHNVSECVPLGFKNGNFEAQVQFNAACLNGGLGCNFHKTCCQLWGKKGHKAYYPVEAVCQNLVLV